MRYMLDLFSGLGGASQAFRDSPNWEIVTVDSKPEFEPTICSDILDLGPNDFDEYDFEVVWASPPCTKFSVASIYRNWKKLENGLYIPKNKETIEHIKLVYHTLWLIDQLNPDYWFLENPTGMLRKVIGNPQGSITYCQYGHTWMKPTDLWGVHPEGFIYKRCSPNSNCHEKSSRGSDSGTQSTRSPAERSRVPYGLSEAILKAVENPEPVNLSTWSN